MSEVESMSAIMVETEAVLRIPDTHPDKSAHLHELGALWLDRYMRTGDMSNIEKACAYLEQAVELTPEDHPDKPACLNNLGISWYKMFERFGNLADIDKAIEFKSRAVELTPDGHPDKPSRLSNLGVSWRHRFERLGNLADIDQAIECQSRAVKLTPDGHADKPGYLSNLGGSWRCRFERLGNLTDLEKTIECGSKASELTSDGHPDKPTCLNNLGISWQTRFERLGSLPDIDKAIQCMSRAVELTPDGHQDKPGWLSNLGNSWRRRFERLGNHTDISSAIECGLKAVEHTPDSHPEKLARLYNLGSSWQSRFDQIGSLADIDRAIECMSRAVELTPDGHPLKPTYLNSLGDSWHRRFKRLDDFADIKKAIEYQLQAVELTPDGHPNKSACLNSLGSSFHSRFTRFGSLNDLDRAIESQSRAVELIPDGHPNKPGRLSNLGNSLNTRFERLGNLADIDKAIEYHSQAVELTPADHSYQPECLSGLGHSWHTRFKQSGSHTDIDKAIECHLRAVEITPDGHPNKPGYLGDLGDSWLSRFKRFSMTNDLKSSIRFFQHGAELVVTRPSTQLQCARIWAQLSILVDSSPLRAYQRAFALLPRLVSLGQTVQERYISILSTSDLTAEAAAWAVSVELYDLALEWLEQGRSVVWSQTLQLRTPFDELAKINSDLANRFRKTASQLDVASSRSQTENASVEPQQTLEFQAQRHRRLAEQWDKLLAEARQLPGFHSFMLPQTSADLKKAAMDGPVVVINTHRSRCDALVIFPECDDIAHIPLENLANHHIDQMGLQVSSWVGCRGGDARGVKYFPPPVESGDRLQPLKDLWLGVVRPVLDALACTRKLPYNELPHVTWCATGALSFLPLHAAGLHDGQSYSTFDLIVSSYTPTLSALLPRRDETVTWTNGILAVGQVNTPGQPPLPMTAEELAIIKKHAVVTLFQQLDGSSATVNATLGAMEQHSWVHLACHGAQNRDNPSQSAFYLHDGCLTLEEIAKRAFKHKGLAFLSACQTATGDNKLPDEATHLAAGMLTAGYPSVIATMWSIMDEDAPLITEEVYAELMKDGAMDHRRAAFALHKALAKLREKVGVEAIGRWAPFIHVGI